MKRLLMVAVCVALGTGLVACSGSKPSTSDTTLPGSGSPAGRPAPDYTKLVTVADVENATGLTGVKVIPADAGSGSGGDINFADETGELVLMANFGDKAWFEANKKTPNYRGLVAGIGDAAFNGPTAEMGPTIYQLGFLKGDTGVLLTSSLSADGEPVVPQPKLEALAKLVLPRLQ